MNWTEIRQRLETPASDALTHEILCELQPSLAELQRRIDARLAPDTSPLDGARLQASLTLSRAHAFQEPSGELEAWVSACHRVSTWTAQRIRPTVSHVRELNGILRALAHAPDYRNTPSQGGRDSYLDPLELPHAMADFEREVLAKAAVLPPLLAASRAYQWLISIHPFEDANGRTARLLADWLLTLGGLPPVSYASPKECLVSVTEARAENTPSGALRVIARGVAHSLALLLKT